MSPVLWWLDNGGDWSLDGGRLRHQLDPDAGEVTLSTRVFYAGLDRESAKVGRGDYVLTAQPGSEYYNPSATATVFINGTPLNSFTSQPRQVVITPLLKDGDNELRLVTVGRLATLLQDLEGTVAEADEPAATAHCVRPGRCGQGEGQQDGGQGVAHGHSLSRCSGVMTSPA